MSDYDRGPYGTHPETPLTIDRQRPPRRGGPAPVTLVISIVLLALAAGGVFYLYRGGVRGAASAPQTVGTPIRDLKVAAPPQAQPEDPAAGLSIYRDKGAAPPSAPTFAAPPEQPTPRPVPPAPAVAPIRSAPLDATAPPPARPVATPAAPPAKPKPAVVATAKPPAAKVATTSPAAPAAPAAPTAPAVSGSAVVQIGAFSSASLAENGWSAAAAVSPGSMAGKGKKVEPITKDGATLYRTSITGFASRDEAKALCDTLIAAGKSCFVK